METLEYFSPVLTIIEMSIGNILQGSSTEGSLTTPSIDPLERDEEGLDF